MIYNPNHAYLSFSEKVKEDILAKKYSDDEALAFLAGFFEAAKCVRPGPGETYTLRVVTERAARAEFLISLLERFDVSCTSVSRMTDLRVNADKFTFHCRDGSDELVRRLGLDKEGDVVPSFVRTSKKRGAAYICGAFIGAGSVTLPYGNSSRSGYHLEYTFPTGSLSHDFCDFLTTFEVLAKAVKRATRFVVYVKSKEIISDILEIMGCWNALEEFDKVVEQRELNNNLNRAANCQVSNIDRSVKASVNMVRDIELILASPEAENLTDELREVCDAKMKSPDSSMSELAAELNITKSCLMHRMNRLTAMAASLKGEDTK